ncbi:hypothetical protein A3Q41_04915 (plasmid) [Rhodococcoides fascians]|uniref:DUF8176 domain-containing protein n=1 Tax=Rhodococcoides fascians TaxID=1828 RepID=A0A143QT31_RHOFA|nr:hypothetical protein [Rhodococcus fascians]AMY26170.1 hypothetical protein A3Q41_04915 [Rhodococcus fascians]
MPAVGENNSPTTDPAHDLDTEHDYADADFGDIAPETVPVPYWVAAHVPADRLVMDQPQRRFRRRRTAAAPTPPVDDATSQLPASPVRPRRRISPTWIVAAGVAAAALIGAVVVVNGQDDAPDPTNSTVVAARPPHRERAPPRHQRRPRSLLHSCQHPRRHDHRRCRGTRKRGRCHRSVRARLLRGRSGAAVASLMVSPAPPERIQAVIDRTPAGTEHCVTIAATDNPDVHAVALALRTPSGSESAIASRITTVRTGANYAISNVEEVR